MAYKLLIGIDGGGTHSTAVAADPQGRVVAVAEGGGLNFHNVGVETVRLRLEAMVEDLCRQTGCKVDEVCVGMSALDAPADAATTAAFCTGMFQPEHLDLQSDAYIALMGLTMGQPGVIIICGTGSMLLMLDGQGNQKPAGGWGYLLGDAGSGYTLAREGLLAIIDATEGTGPSTPLVEDSLSYFNVTAPRAIIDRVYDPAFSPDKLAGFARHVIARAVEGDEVALGILRRNMQRLANTAAQLIASTPEAARIGLYGGIFQHSELAVSLFTDAVKALAPQAEICRPNYPPELGALIHLYQKRGMLNADVLAKLKSTYEEIRK